MRGNTEVHKSCLWKYHPEHIKSHLKTIQHIYKVLHVVYNMQIIDLQLQYLIPIKITEHQIKDM